MKLISTKFKDNDNIAEIVTDADTHNWTRYYGMERTIFVLVSA